MILSSRLVIKKERGIVKKRRFTTNSYAKCANWRKLLCSKTKKKLNWQLISNITLSIEEQEVNVRTRNMQDNKTVTLREIILG